MCVTISLRGKDLDPDKITSYLNQKPSFAFRKGEEFNSDSTKGEEFIRSNGGWIYHSTDSIDGKDVYEHLSHVMKVLQQSTKYICDDDNIESAEIDIFLSLEVFDGKSNMGYFRLCKDNLIVLQQQGLELVVSYDVYCEMNR